MSNGGGSTTVNSVPDWVRPYAENYMQAAGLVASQPYQPYGASRVAQMNPYESAGYTAQAERAIAGSPVSNAAANELTRTISGNYLNNNPYMNSMVDLASRDVMRNMTNLDARSGSFGNSGVQQNTASALGDISTQLRGADYAAERGRMLGAVGMAPQIANQDYVDAQQLQSAGRAFRQQDQANITDDYNQFLEARNYPREQLGVLGQGLGFNFGNTSSSRDRTNPWATAAGAAATYYGAGGGQGK